MYIPQTPVYCSYDAAVITILDTVTTRLIYRIVRLLLGHGQEFFFSFSTQKVLRTREKERKKEREIGCKIIRRQIIRRLPAGNEEAKRGALIITRLARPPPPLPSRGSRVRQPEGMSSVRRGYMLVKREAFNQLSRVNTY